MASRNEFDTSTRVPASSELDQLLEHAGDHVTGRYAAGTPDPDDDVDFEPEHTRIGDHAALAALAATTAPPPRASINVIRRGAPVPRTLPLPPPRPSTELPADPPAEVPVVAAAIEVQAPAVEASAAQAPAIEAPFVEMAARVATRARTPWGLVAWLVLLIALVAISTVGYVKITNLERELAEAKAKLTR